MLRQIKIDWNPQKIAPLELTFAATTPAFPGLTNIDSTAFSDFLDTIGLVGMGGSGFPASEKIRAADQIHTLVINGAECEPGITVDQSILLNDGFHVLDGAQSYANAIGAEKIVLAVRDHEPFVSKIRKRYSGFRIITLPDRYPAGAEKLILKELLGRMPAAGTRPHELGYLVQNVASLRAIGRAVVDGIPVIERPLSFIMPSTGFYKNLIVPIGVTAQQMIERYKLIYKPSRHIIVESGLMMGHEIQPEEPVKPTTTSLIILKREKVTKKERPCIRCGTCNSACPLGLHPFAITERFRKGKILDESYKAQLEECFLCGVCAAVCPSDIPLIQQLKKGKECL